MDSLDIQKAADIIRNGGVGAFPTETVYGLGANALDPIAVAKIFAHKERPTFDPLIVHIAHIDTLHTLTKDLDPIVLELAKHFWPGPLTMVLPKSNIVPDLVTSGLQTVGIRMPNNTIALELISKAQTPIAAPSANKFGQLSPSSAKHVQKQLPDIDFILDGGDTTVGIESTIISIDSNTITLLRPGIITKEEIEAVLPNNWTVSSEKPKDLIAPGLLQSHYSPKKPLYIFTEIPESLQENSGYIFHSSQPQFENEKSILYTSENNNLLEVAAHLFSALHAMEDNDSICNIFIHSIPEESLGIAIMDRVKKAAFQYNK